MLTIQRNVGSYMLTHLQEGFFLCLQQLKGKLRLSIKRWSLKIAQSGPYLFLLNLFRPFLPKRYPFTFEVIIVWVFALTFQFLITSLPKKCPLTRVSRMVFWPYKKILMATRWLGLWVIKLRPAWTKFLELRSWVFISPSWRDISLLPLARNENVLYDFLYGLDLNFYHSILYLTLKKVETFSIVAIVLQRNRFLYCPPQNGWCCTVGMVSKALRVCEFGLWLVPTPNVFSCNPHHINKFSSSKLFTSGIYDAQKVLTLSAPNNS